MRTDGRKGIGSISDLILGVILFSAFVAGMGAFLSSAASPVGMSPPGVARYNQTNAIGSTINQTKVAVFSSDISITDRLFAVATAAWNAIKIPKELIGIVETITGQAQADVGGLIPNDTSLAISMIVTSIIMLSIMAAVFRVGRI